MLVDGPGLAQRSLQRVAMVVFHSRRARARGSRQMIGAGLTNCLGATLGGFIGRGIPRVLPDDFKWRHELARILVCRVGTRRDARRREEERERQASGLGGWTPRDDERRTCPFGVGSARGFHHTIQLYGTVFTSFISYFDPLGDRTDTPWIRVWQMCEHTWHERSLLSGVDIVFNPFGVVGVSDSFCSEKSSCQSKVWTRGPRGTRPIVEYTLYPMPNQLFNPFPRFPPRSAVFFLLVRPLDSISFYFILLHPISLFFPNSLVPSKFHRCTRTYCPSACPSLRLHGPRKATDISPRRDLETCWPSLLVRIVRTALPQVAWLVRSTAC